MSKDELFIKLGEVLISDKDLPFFDILWALGKLNNIMYAAHEKATDINATKVKMDAAQALTNLGPASLAHVVAWVNLLASLVNQMAKELDENAENL